MRILSSLLLFCILSAPLPALSQATETSPTVPLTVERPLAFGLPDGTPVKLRISRNLSSADAKTGETVDFEVLEEIKKDLLDIYQSIKASNGK